MPVVCTLFVDRRRGQDVNDDSIFHAKAVKHNHKDKREVDFDRSKYSPVPLTPSWWGMHAVITLPLPPVVHRHVLIGEAYFNRSTEQNLY